jgi:hypothetical protein
MALESPFRAYNSRAVLAQSPDVALTLRKEGDPSTCFIAVVARNTSHVSRARTNRSSYVGNGSHCPRMELCP